MSCLQLYGLFLSYWQFNINSSSDLFVLKCVIYDIVWVSVAVFTSGHLVYPF